MINKKIKFKDWINIDIFYNEIIVGNQKEIFDPNIPVGTMFYFRNFVYDNDYRNFTNTTLKNTKLILNPITNKKTSFDSNNLEYPKWLDITNIDIRNYYHIIGEYKFVLCIKPICPINDDNIDSHLYYDTWISKGIPVIIDKGDNKKQILNKYPELPIIWITEIEQLTPDYLLSTYKTIQNKYFNFSKLFKSNYSQNIITKMDINYEKIYKLIKNKFKTPLVTINSNGFCNLITNHLSITESNNILIHLILSNKPFSIVRLGDMISKVSVSYLLNKEINENMIYKLHLEDGIYLGDNKNFHLNLYCKHYNNAIKKSDAMAVFYSSINNQWINEQNYYIQNFNLKSLEINVLDPYYLISLNIDPWTYLLSDKIILVVSFFKESLEKQYNLNFSYFNQSIFGVSSNPKIIFYKCYNNLINRKSHNNWYETYNCMCNDISKINFDIAFLGCGGYGIPLCNYIKTDLKKSAIYMGGNIQTLFGVIGKRWMTDKGRMFMLFRERVKNSKSKVIRPNNEEIIRYNKLLTNGCYW